MKIFRLIIALLAALAAMPAFAESNESGAIVGKVVAVYLREAENFFAEPGIFRDVKGKQQWTEVRFAAPLEDGRKTEIVRLPEGTKVERGDLISTQLAGKRGTIPGLLPEVNRMVALVAKHDTVAAMNFDAPKPVTGSVLPYVQALQSLR